MLKRLLLSLLLFTVVLNATTPTYENVTKLYVATFGRAPDACGLYSWVSESKMTLEEIAISFFNQAETQSKYPPSLSNSEFVETVYVNLFGHSPDPDQLAYWVNELDSGNISRSLFILAVINSAQGTDADILDNQTEVGLYFATRGHCDQEAATLVMADVTEDHTTVEDSIIEIDKLEPDCGVVIDIQTGLMWQNNLSSRYTWPEAVDYCSNEVALCGGTNWRLPTIEELESIVYTGNYPTILSIFGGNCYASHYWSASGTDYSKYIVKFYNGTKMLWSISGEANVRCVRDREGRSSGYLPPIISYLLD